MADRVIDNLTVTIEDRSPKVRVAVIDPDRTKVIKVRMPGVQGGKGLSAYQVAVENGYVGTEEEWLRSLHADIAEIYPDPTETFIDALR